MNRIKDRNDMQTKDELYDRNFIIWYQPFGQMLEKHHQLHLLQTLCSQSVPTGPITLLSSASATKFRPFYSFLETRCLWRSTKWTNPVPRMSLKEEKGKAKTQKAQGGGPAQRARCSDWGRWKFWLGERARSLLSTKLLEKTRDRTLPDCTRTTSVDLSPDFIVIVGSSRGVR